MSDCMTIFYIINDIHYSCNLIILDIDTVKNVCAKHFDPEEIIDTQTYIDIDGQTKTRNIKATLKKGAVPKYLPGCPSYLKASVNGKIISLFDDGVV